MMIFSPNALVLLDLLEFVLELKKGVMESNIVSSPVMFNRQTHLNVMISLSLPLLVLVDDSSMVKIVVSCGSAP